MTTKPDLSGNKFLSAAQAILAKSGTPMRPADLTTQAIESGLITTTGKTPEASMSAQLYTHINKHGAASPFVQAGKGLFGLRVWATPEPPAPSPAPDDPPPQAPAAPPTLVTLAPTLVEVARIVAAQHDSGNSVAFEHAIADAFTFLGFNTQHVGGAGKTDVILDAPITGGAYRVIVDAKSSKNGKVSDAHIDWNSLRDHREDVNADHALVVAPGFGGGNLLKRADEYEVALLTGQELCEVVRLHQAAPFSLLEQRRLFGKPGPATAAVSSLRGVAEANRSRVRLLRRIIDLVHGLPSGAYPDATNIWLILSIQQKQAAPTQDDVKDAVAVLASRVVGILKPNETSSGYVLTMKPETAVARLQALARLASEDAPSEAASSAGGQATAPA